VRVDGDDLEDVDLQAAIVESVPITPPQTTSGVR